MNAKVLPFVPADDPVLRLPSPAEMEALLRGPEAESFMAFLTDRQAQIENREKDPFRHGYEPAIWGVCDDLLCRGVKVVLIDPVDSTPREIMGGSEIYCSGGNRSSKTEYAASRLVRQLVKKPWARAWAFHTTGPSSIAMQQPRVWKYLPPEWKNMRKSRVADIKFSPKNGFAGITPNFVGPNGAQCWFKNYAQSEDTIEGEELDLCWLDELVPISIIEGVRLRLATRNGVLIITFTPIKGYTPTVKTLIHGATDVLSVPATLLPILGEDGQPTGRLEKVPRVQQAMIPDLKIVYFHIFDNPFGNAPEVIKKAATKGRDGIKCRCYGVPTETIGAQFTMFKAEIHVITREHFAAHCKTGTNKHVTDPCSGRNWFHLWARALPDERTLVIYREWPTPGGYIRGVGDPGWWAEPDGKLHDGKRGDAQKPWGFGHERNAEEILRAEGWQDAQILDGIRRQNCMPGKGEAWAKAETIFQRDMDSRFGAAPTLARGESTTLIDSMAELGMQFEPAPGEHQQEGIDEIQNLLYFDSEKAIGPENKPRLLITENCRNLIFALETFTGMDGPHGACKDPVDVLRYISLAPPLYLPDYALKSRGGGSY